jgi:hypothetical protein
MKLLCASLCVGIAIVTSATAADPKDPAQPPAHTAAPKFVDLQWKFNERLSSDLHGFKGNNLSKLPHGVEDYAGVKFSVGEGYIKLGGKLDTERPKKVHGIKVDATGARIQILHGTGYGAGGGIVTDGAKIAEYVIHYEDESTASIPIHYGTDVRDWWSWGKSPEVTRGKIAWAGTNDFSEEEDQIIRLYLTTWENPKPALKITTIDYISTNQTPAAPFCIAITLEAK